MPFGFIDGLLRPRLRHQGDRGTVNQERLPIDHVGVIAGEVADKGRDVVRVQLLQFVALRQGSHAASGPNLRGAVGNSPYHPGLGPGRDGIAGRAVAAHVPGHHLCEAGDARFSRAVVGLTRVAHQPRLGTKRYDPPRALLPEQYTGMLHNGESALQMHRDHVVPLFLGHVEDHPVPQDAGAGDHDVQPSVIIDGRLDDPISTGHAGDRLHAGHRRSTSLGDLSHNLLGDRLVGAGTIYVNTRVYHHHLGPFLSHHLGHSPANATAGTGDDGNLAL